MKLIFKLLIINVMILSFIQCKTNYVSSFKAKHIAIDTLQKLGEYDNALNPFRVESQDSVWCVTSYRDKDSFGGNYYIYVNKKNGKVIKIRLTK
jgi:hypothetical protein